MGTYYNPPQQLRDVARALPVSPDATYAEAMRHVQSDEVLFGLGDQLIFWNAPYLFSEQEFNAFRDVYRKGYYVSYGLYAMPVNTFREYFNKEPYAQSQTV